MREQKEKTMVVPDKVAGLESHQFSRDEHRFAALTKGAIEKRTDLRQPRVGTNHRNNSSEVFTFGGDWAFPQETERYVSDPAGHEKLRLQQKREKLENRVDVKRQWISDIEKNRWNKMSNDFVKEKNMWESKHQKTRIGQHSVHYDPITLQYHPTPQGNSLREADEKAMNRVAMRSVKLYLKRNTFDPLLGRDISHKLDEDVARAAELSKPSSQSSDQSPQRPLFGRRSYRMTDSGGVGSELSTPKILFDALNESSKLVEKSGSKPTKMTGDVNQVTQWARHY